jgi:hypothetical protein
MSSASKLLIESNNGVDSVDDFLTNKPEMTFFKNTYKKHTNYSFDWVDVNIDRGNVDFGEKIVFKMSNSNYDMIQDCVLKIVLPQIESPNSTDLINWIDKVGHAIIKKITLKIGNDKVIVTHNGEYMEIHNQLNMQNEKLKTYYNMIGYNKTFVEKTLTTNPYVLYIPLIFWFNKDIGLSLPICAIQNHDVTIEIELQQLSKLYYKYTDAISANVVSGQQLKATMLTKYYKLGEVERKKMINMKHKYLIEQIQEIEHVVGATDGKEHNVPLLGLKLPIKEMIWTGQPLDFYDDNNLYRLNSNSTPDYNFPFKYSHLTAVGAGRNFFKNFSFNVNGLSYFENVDPQVFNLYLPYRYHNRTPDEGIFIYSFANNPTQYQPSGSVNFTRLSTKDTYLRVKFNDAVTDILGTKSVKIKFYAINYNFLEIENGSVSLAFLE